jgi:hypothetical protein
MSRKFAIILVFVVMFMAGVALTNATAVTTPDLTGTWKGTVNRVSLAGVSSDPITLVVLQQCGSLIRGNVTIGQRTVNFAGSISANSNPPSFDIDGYQWLGSGSRVAYISAQYNSTPLRIDITSIYIHETHNYDLWHTQYDVASLFRQ